MRGAVEQLAAGKLDLVEVRRTEGTDTALSYLRFV